MELRFSGVAERERTAALAFRSGPVRTSSLMSTVWLAYEPVTWPESIARPATVDFVHVAVPPTFLQLGRTDLRNGQCDGHVGRSVQRCVRELLALCEERSGSFRTARELRANLARGHLEIDRWRTGKRAPASVESTSDALVCNTSSSTVRPLPVNVNAPVSEPLNRSSSSHVDLERRGEPARIQPGDVAARRIAQRAIARLDREQRAGAKRAPSTIDSSSSRSAPVAPARLERIVAGGLGLELRHRQRSGSRRMSRLRNVPVERYDSGRDGVENRTSRASWRSRRRRRRSHRSARRPVQPATVSELAEPRTRPSLARSPPDSRSPRRAGRRI